MLLAWMAAPRRSVGNAFLSPKAALANGRLVDVEERQPGRNRQAFPLDGAVAHAMHRTSQDQVLGCALQKIRYDASYIARPSYIM